MHLREDILQSLAEELSSHNTTSVHGFSYWRRGLDPELSREDGPLFQLYAGLAVLVRDMNHLIEENPKFENPLFNEIVKPIIEDNRARYPKTTLFQSKTKVELPRGIAASSVDGRPNLQSLADSDIVHEWITKPGKQIFNGFGVKFHKMICGKGGIYDQLRKGILPPALLAVEISKQILSEGFSAETLWYPLAVYIATIIARKTLEKYCEG